MINWQKNMQLIKLMIMEDYRMQAAIIGKFQFFFFPILIAIFALVISLSSTVLLENVPLDRIYFLLHMIILVYGVSVGGFAMFGEQIAERRFGHINLILQSPELQPIEFRTLFMLFYVKDIILYLFFSLIPIIMGIGFSIPVTGFKITSVAFLFVTITLTFLTGISFAFFLSTVLVRMKAAAAVILVFVLAIFGIGRFTDLYEFESLIPSLMFQYTYNPLYLIINLILVIFFSLIAVKYIKIEFGKAAERYPEQIRETKQRFEFTKGYSTFIAKEWLDMRRSGTMGPVLGAYVGPMIFLSFMIWIFRTIMDVPLDFNIVFFASMVGFFGVTIYSWLNVNDNPEFYQVLPVKVPQIIKSKLVLFGIFTYAIATVFIIILSIIYSELELLWLALIVAYVTTTYTVIVTAHLTGIRTNVYLFDTRVLMKFTGMVAIPLIIITIASFLIDDNFSWAVMIIGGICTVLVISLIGLYNNIDKKWGNERFIF
jgi:hypothetical protein